MDGPLRGWRRARNEQGARLLPSKAFYRCRSCGEPLRTEALRCPFCGAAHPTAATPSLERTEAAGQRAAAPPVDALGEVSAAAATVVALDRTPAGTPRREPRLGGLGAAPAGGAAADRRVEPSLRPVSGAATAQEPGAPAGASPESGAEGDRPREAADAESTALVAHARADEGEAPTGGALTTAPGGERRGRTVRRRARSFVARLTRIAAMILIIIGIIGAGQWWMRNNNLPDLGLEPGATSGSVANLAAHGGGTLVEVGAGWEPVLRDAAEATRGALIEADGPFRLRVDGAVYTIEAGRPVRVSLAPGSTVEVKAVRPPARVEVTPIPGE